MCCLPPVCGSCTLLCSDTVFPLTQKRKAQISVSKVHFHPVTRPVWHNAPLCTSAALILGMCCRTFVAFPPSCARIIFTVERQTDGRLIRPLPASEPARAVKTNVAPRLPPPSPRELIKRSEIMEVKVAPYYHCFSWNVGEGRFRFYLQIKKAFLIRTCQRQTPLILSCSRAANRVVRL